MRDDSTAGGEPLDYLHGYRNIIVGLEEALDGVEAGFQTQVTVQPDKGYGEVDASAVFAVPIDQFPTDRELEAGMTVVGELQDGPVRFTVREVRDQEREVVLDGNHPLAGMTLHFAVEVVGVRSKLPVHGLPAREEVGVNPKAGTVDGAVCEATIAFLTTSGRTWVSSA